MSGRSVNLTTLLLGRPPKQLISTLCTYFRHLLTTALLKPAEGETKVCGWTKCRTRDLWLLSQKRQQRNYAGQKDLHLFEVKSRAWILYFHYSLFTRIDLIVTLIFKLATWSLHAIKWSFHAKHIVSPNNFETHNAEQRHGLDTTGFHCNSWTMFKCGLWPWPLS